MPRIRGLVCQAQPFDWITRNIVPVATFKSVSEYQHTGLTIMRVYIASRQLIVLIVSSSSVCFTQKGYFNVSDKLPTIIKGPCDGAVLNNMT